MMRVVSYLTCISEGFDYLSFSAQQVLNVIMADLISNQLI